VPLKTKNSTKIKDMLKSVPGTNRYWAMGKISC